MPVSSSSTDANCPVSAISWRTCTASVTTSYPQIRACPASGLQQRGQHPDRGGLAGAVRAQQASTVPRPGGDVNAAQRLGVAEASWSGPRPDHVFHGESSG